ncbi:MAG: hypothetical protein ACK5VO_06150 [Betaproteobacteria bacterium]
MRVISLSFRLLLAACAAVLASGCATVTGEPTQPVSIVVVDQQDRPVADMRCRVSNGSAQYVGNAPMFSVPVRRSSSDLQIECRNGTAVARGTAVSRGGLQGMAAAVLPGGTTALVIDHVTGYRYTYPTSMRLRTGEHLVFDATDNAVGRPTRGLLADTPR